MFDMKAEVSGGVRWDLREENRGTKAGRRFIRNADVIMKSNMLYIGFKIYCKINLSVQKKKQHVLDRMIISSKELQIIKFILCSFQMRFSKLMDLPEE